MTKAEGNRLAAVEIKIDSMSKEMTKDMSALKEFLIEKINATEKANAITMAGQDKAIGIAMTASEKAIIKAEIANDLHFCEQDKRIDEYVKSTNAAIKTLTENKDINTGAKTGVKDFQNWVTWGITVLGFVLMYFVLRGV